MKIYRIRTQNPEGQYYYNWFSDRGEAQTCFFKALEEEREEQGVESSMFDEFNIPNDRVGLVCWLNTHHRGAEL